MISLKNKAAFSIGATLGIFFLTLCIVACNEEDDSKEDVLGRMEETMRIEDYLFIEKLTPLLIDTTVIYTKTIKEEP